MTEGNCGPPRYRGSYTVEASLLMSVILMVLFLILQMTLFLTDSVRMTALLVESSTYTAEEEADHSRWITGARKGFFYLKGTGARRSAGKTQVKVSYPAESVSLSYGRKAEVDLFFSHDLRDPVKYMRTIQALKNVGKASGG